VCLAAKDNGLDISGSIFRLGGEPYTPAKARIIEESGVRAGCFYSMSEAGPVGVPCADGDPVDDVHLLAGKVALIQRTKPIGTSGYSADAFYITTLLSSSPKIMLNMESDDYGVITRRRCGCPFGEIGLDDHIHTIRSYEKLTSEGMTFLGAELYTLLEEVLPKKFGGNATDYQLVEEEVEGLPRVRILVSPRVGRLDEDDVVRATLEFLGARDDGHRMMAGLWAEGHTLQVIRREPLATATSKILPLHILKR
jgi:hypothetical protein